MNELRNGYIRDEDDQEWTGEHIQRTKSIFQSSFSWALQEIINKSR